MPFLNLRTIKGLLDEESKTFLMEEFTKLLIATEGKNDPNFRKMVWIQIEEEEPGNWQIGELRPTVQLIERLKNKKPVP